MTNQELQEIKEDLIEEGFTGGKTNEARATFFLSGILEILAEIALRLGEPGRVRPDMGPK